MLYLILRNLFGNSGFDSKDYVLGIEDLKYLQTKLLLKTSLNFAN
jgi:hypothetical protein